MNKVTLFNCFDCNNGFLLIEAVINEPANKIDFSRFSVEQNASSNKEDRKLYAIQFLDPKGISRICDLFSIPGQSIPCRIAFFVAKNGGEILNTPYGAFDLREPERLPDRLINCIDFIGMADRDRYDYYNDVELETEF